MVNLDLRIWNVHEWNSSIVGWLWKDVWTAVANSAWAVWNVISRSAANIAQNTSKLTRNPWKTISQASSWGKFFKTFPSAAADIWAKTMSLPFRTFEWALTYGLANNMERVVWGAKWITTDAARNWFHNGGQANKFMRGMWHFIGWAGDLVGSAAKLWVFVPEWIIKKVNDVATRPLISTTQGWVENQRLDGVDFWQPNMLENIDYTPANAANDNEATRAVA